MKTFSPVLLLCFCRPYLFFSVVVQRARAINLLCVLSGSAKDLTPSPPPFPSVAFQTFRDASGSGWTSLPPGRFDSSYSSCLSENCASFSP